MLSPPVQAPAQVAKLDATPRPSILAVKTKAIALLGAADTDWNALRTELRKAVAASEKRPGRLHPATLTLRGLAGLVLDRQGEERGLRLFAEACGTLHRQLKLIQRIHGAEAKETVPFLEALQELYQLEKLPGDRWEDLALRAELRHGKEPRPDLEKRVVAAVERHYGPFLSFRAADRGAVLEDVAMLLELWERRGKPAGPTREFLEVGLRSDARGVWKLVAAHADPPLREAMKAMLASLAPDLLVEDLRNFLIWLPAQGDTPWTNAARSLAESVDAALQKAKLPAAAVLQRRVRLAKAMGEAPRAITMVSEALRQSREDHAAILALAEELAHDTEDPALHRLLHESLLMDLPRVAEEPAGRSLLVADAHRLEAQGDFSSAELLWRCLLDRPRTVAAESGPSGAGALEHALGRNLAAQHRWEEARSLLEPLTAMEKWQADPSLRFLLASLEAGLGDAESARRWARAGLSLLAPEEPLKPVPGLASALRLLLQDTGPIQEVLERVRRGLDPEGRLPALRDPATLLTLLEGLERPSAKPHGTPKPACRGPWSALGGNLASQGLALLQAAEGVRLEDAEPCLREALRFLERAWGEQDPRLLKPLLRLGQCLQDQSNPDAEAVFRRILGICAAQPETDPLLETEARARLGQLLGEAGREEEADALLEEALHRLVQAPELDSSGREMLGGVLVMRVARLEYREDYLGILEVLEQVAELGEKIIEPPKDGFGLETELRKIQGEKARFTRLFRLQALLRVQGLP